MFDFIKCRSGVSKIDVRANKVWIRYPCQRHSPPSLPRYCYDRMQLFPSTAREVVYTNTAQQNDYTNLSTVGTYSPAGLIKIWTYWAWTQTTELCHIVDNGEMPVKQNHYNDRWRDRWVQAINSFSLDSRLCFLFKLLELSAGKQTWLLHDSTTLSYAQNRVPSQIEAMNTMVLRFVTAIKESGHRIVAKL